MDIVYICRSGDNEELRYSLRSLKHIPHDNVWVFGDAPEWFTGNLVKTQASLNPPQEWGKYTKAHRNWEEVVKHPDISDDFMLFNDDFYVMKRQRSLLNFHRGCMQTMADHYILRHPNSNYTKSINKTLKWLHDLGITEPLSYELHLPMAVNKAKFAAILDKTMGHERVLLRSIYGNVYNVGGKEIPDCKVYGTHTPLENCRNYMSSVETAFAAVEPILRWTFPEPSEFERDYGTKN